MEQQKKCPACGETLAPGAAQCPSCQLEGLDQIFLSRADYDNWVQKVLKPHIGRLSRRVFSDGDTLLIMTGDGTLYGMGHNFAGQIVENGSDYIDEPVYIASGVVSASAYGSYIIFATEDGRIHIRGRGEFADRVPEFTDAREVFVVGSQFFVVNHQGQVFAFGVNRDGILEPEREELLMVFPEASSVQRDFYEPYDNYSKLPSDYDRYSAECEIRKKIMETEEYQTFAQRYEPSNLHIHLKLTYTSRFDYYYNNCYPHNRFDQTYHFIPTLVLRNTYLYTPVLYHDQNYGNTPHRQHAYPLSQYGRRPLEAYPQIKKACLYYGSKYLAVCHDGTLVWFDRDKEKLHQLDWPMAPVCDLAIGPYGNTAIIACRDGRVYLVDKENLPKFKVLWEIPIS